MLEKERLKHLKKQDYAKRQMKKSKRDGDNHLNDNSVVLGKHSHADAKGPTGKPDG